MNTAIKPITPEREQELVAKLVDFLSSRYDAGNLYDILRHGLGMDHSDMDTLMEFSIQGDIFFFYDTLSEEEKETVRKCMRAKYKGNIVGDPKIDEFLEELERDHGIRLKRLPVTSVIAV